MLDNGQQYVEGIKAGDKKVFETAFRAYYPQLCAYARKFVHDTDAAEEIVQDLFFNIWQKHNELNVASSLKSYLYRSVHNSCMNHFKHLSVRNKHIEVTQEETGNLYYEATDTIEQEEMHEKLRQAIDNMPPERKKVFLLSRFEELKYKEIAEKLEISIKTVENQMGKALKYLREELSEYLPVLVFGFIIKLINFFEKIIGG